MATHTARRGLVDRWVAAARASIENLEPDELARELRRREHAVVVDVRGADEHLTERIEGSINVPRGRLELDGVPERRPTRVIVYCDTGERSALAADLLYELGFDDVAHLDGGLRAWELNGHPVERGHAPDAEHLDERRAHGDVGEAFPGRH